MVPFVNLSPQIEDMKADGSFECMMHNINKAINSGSFIGGKFLEEFEEEFAAYCGSSYAVGVASGTDALIISLESIGIMSGDKVITAPNTFFATVEAIISVGADPVFIDVDEETQNIDAQKLLKFLKYAENEEIEPIKAIIPVHMFGNPVDMNAIVGIADEFGLDIIEDACQAHGALYNDMKCGTFGRTGCFSFYPGKNLGAFGDAGMIVTDEEDLYSLAKSLRNHGQAAKGKHNHIGHNSRLDTIQSIVLKEKLNHLDRWNTLRREAAFTYNELLKGIGDIILPFETDAGRSVYHLFIIRTEYRNKLREYLNDNDIQTGIHYPVPIHLQEPFSGMNGRSLSISEMLAKEILSLPMFPGISFGQISLVVDRIERFFEESGEW